MSADRRSRVRELYDALSQAPMAERERVLNEVCRDPDMRTEVLALLAVTDAAARAPRPASTPPLVPGAVLCERFVIKRLIGQGGMGEVWAARDRQLEEDVAIKTIRPSMVNEAGGVSRFKREIQLARRIGHPNVCRVHELFEDTSVTPSRLFLTMELLAGETLSAKLRHEGPLTTGAAFEIFRQIAAGLAAAHDAGVIHRDLKPLNIMITATASPGRVVLMDFGLARVNDLDRPTGDTQVGALIGTPEYMAPEQISGVPATPATDIYALGLILFEMLRGKPPFAADTTIESWMRRAREGPERLSGVVPGVQARVDSVIARCLEYEPARRFQSARQVWDALQSPWTTVARSSRDPVFAAAAVLVIALVGTGAWSLVAGLRGAERPPAEALQWYEEAQRALAEGASVRALNDINRAIAIAPRFPTAHVALAEIRLALDMPGRAQEAMLQATDLAPDRSRLPADEAAYLDGIQQLLLRNCDASIASLGRVADTARDVDRPYRLIGVARAMERCGQPKEAMAALDDVIRLDPRSAAAPLAQSRLLAARNDFTEAEASLLTAESLYRDRGSSEGVAEVLATRGMFQLQQNQLDAAEDTLRKAEELARSIDDIRQQIRVSLQQAIVHRRRGGDLTAANAMTTAAIALARQHNLETLTLEALVAAANVHLFNGQSSEAQSLFERALEIAETHRHDEYRARVQVSLASLLVRQFQPARAAEAIAAARPYYERTGHLRNLAAADAILGQIRIMQGDYVGAIAQFEDAVRAASTAGDVDGEMTARENLATALTGAGRYPPALEHYARLVMDYGRSGRVLNESFAMLNVADVASRLGRFDEAEDALAQARRRRSDARELEPRLLRVEGDIALRRGDYDRARAAASRIVEVERAISLERAVRARQTVCLAGTRTGQRAAETCEALLDAVPREFTILWIENRLAAAEARLPHDLRGAETLIAEVASATDTLGEHQDRWRWLALAAAAAGTSSSRSDAALRLTREVDRLRVLWGKNAVEAWARRADVMRLLAAAGVEIGDH